ncbi:MAG: Na(+)/H(+) antiporter subunit D [Syntrophomonadaceae bacterium]|nr:Na(+)/H(+) antiporter subunit D [Bacillota bacterium]
MTQTLHSWQPAAAVFIMYGFVLLQWLCNNKLKDRAHYLSVAALIASMLPLLTLADEVFAGWVFVVEYALLPPFGLSFRLDRLSLLMAVSFQLLGGVAVLCGTVAHGGSSTRRFQTALLFVLASALGMVLAGDLLSMYLFFEAMSLTFFILVIYRGDRLSAAATMKYLYMTIGGSVLYFAALAAVFVGVGSFAWQEGGFFPSGPFLWLAFWGFAAAFALKSAMFPLHFWMADVYANAPLPAVLLSSMVLLKTGAYGMIRLIHHVFGPEVLGQNGWQPALLALASFTILYGSVCAFAQRDLLRRLAYSGMAQLGYIYLGIFLLTPAALTGSIYHMMSHAVFKGLMLLCAGEILKQTGRRSVEQLFGVGRQLPLTMICFSLSALTVIGLPPFNVFFSKWYLGTGALAAGQPLLLVLLLVSSMLNAAYYLPIVIGSFFGVGEQPLGKLRCESFARPIFTVLALLAIANFAFALSPENWLLRCTEAVVSALYQGE